MVVCWSGYWLFVAPTFIARQGEKHYQKDLEECYRDYGSKGQVADNDKVLAYCLEESKREWTSVVSSGLHFREGDSFSHKAWRSQFPRYSSTVAPGLSRLFAGGSGEVLGRPKPHSLSRSPLFYMGSRRIGSSGFWRANGGLWGYGELQTQGKRIHALPGP
jgi:hypothetical protein